MFNETQLKDAFMAFDKDNNGFLDKDELKGAFAPFKGGLTDEEIHALMVEADTNGDGQISFEEFAVLIKKIS
ncbi:MAG: hypothetical protein RIT27_1561 [Pseudomonadota bacterium]|jgi:calmodulin